MAQFNIDLNSVSIDAETKEEAEAIYLEMIKKPSEALTILNDYEVN